MMLVGGMSNSSLPISVIRTRAEPMPWACSRFFAWCEQRGLALAAIRPFDVASYIEGLQQQHSAPGVKQQLAAVRMLFDWLITGQVLPTNPAAAVRGPKHVVKTGKTPVLEGVEWRKLLDSIPATTLRDLRDRALTATLTYSFARINAALKMKVEDLRPRGAGWTIRLHEKGGKQHAMPCHHALAEALRAYIDAAGIVEDRKGWLFRTARGHDGSSLSDKPMSRPDAWRMIRRRAAAAGIAAEIGRHTFRATGITAYLATAVRSSMRRRWRRTKARVRRSYTTERRSALRRTRSRGSGSEWPGRPERAIFSSYFAPVERLQRPAFHLDL
jgi:site-specific recombinase XerD